MIGIHTPLPELVEGKPSTPSTPSTASTSSGQASSGNGFCPSTASTASAASTSSGQASSGQARSGSGVLMCFLFKNVCVKVY
jgi:hypothetical protein